MKRILLLLLVVLTGCSKEIAPIAVTGCKMSDDKASYEVYLGARGDELVQIDQQVTMDLTNYYPDDREKFVKELKESGDYDEVYYDEPNVVLISRELVENTKKSYYSLEETMNEYIKKGFECDADDSIRSE